MTDTFTPSLRLTKEQTATNTGVWGSILNNGMIALLDDAIAGAASIDMTTGAATLTTANGASDQARNMTLLLTGTPAGASTLFVPKAQKVYTIENSCGQTVTVRSASGSGVAIANGVRATVFMDADNDVVRQPFLSSDQAVLAQTGLMTAYPSHVQNSTGGTTDPTYYAVREGGQIIFGSPGYSVTVNSAAFIVVPQSGVFPVTDGANLEGLSLFVDFGGTIRETVMALDDSAVIYSRADTVALPGPPFTATLPAHWFISRGT